MCVLARLHECVLENTHLKKIRNIKLTKHYEDSVLSLGKLRGQSLKSEEQAELHAGLIAIFSPYGIALHLLPSGVASLKLEYHKLSTLLGGTVLFLLSVAQAQALSPSSSRWILTRCADFDVSFLVVQKATCGYVIVPEVNSQPDLVLWIQYKLFATFTTLEVLFAVVIFTILYGMRGIKCRTSRTGAGHRITAVISYPYIFRTTNGLRLRVALATNNLLLNDNWGIKRCES